MNGRGGIDGQGAEVDVLYERANERIAKAVAFAGSYVIWSVLAAIACVLLVLAI